MTSYRPDPAILTLGGDFYDPVEPARFPECIPRFLNRALGGARRAAISTSELGSAISAASSRCPTTSPSRWRCAITATSSACTIRTSATAAASCSRSFATIADRLLDLGTKGSGQTPYSRHADGRLTLKGGVREVLATEMLEALGRQHVEELRLVRDRRGAGARRRALADPLGGAHPAQPRPHPHRHLPAPRLLRRGREHQEARPLLPRQSLRRAAGGDDAENALRLFDLVSAATARLAASYLAAGFVHGVLNSDNINITGESFDYGPWRFTPDWDPDFTAAYFDHYGLYAFGRQPEAIHWDLAQLAGCLSLVAEAPPLSDMLAGWSERFEQALVDAMLRRLGVARGRASDRELAAALIEALAIARRRPIDRIFFDWRGGRDPGAERYPVRAVPRARQAARGSRARRNRTHIGRTRALLDAYRGGRGDLVGDRRARRLAAVRGQGYSGPADGRGDGAGCTGKLDEAARGRGARGRGATP